MISDTLGNIKSVTNKASQLLIKDNAKGQRIFENKVISDFHCQINAYSLFSDISVEVSCNATTTLHRLTFHPVNILDSKVNLQDEIKRLYFTLPVTTEQKEGEGQGSLKQAKLNLAVLDTYEQPPYWVIQLKGNRKQKWALVKYNKVDIDTVLCTIKTIE